MVLPKKESMFIACLVALISVLFSNWLLFEVVLLIVVLSFAIRGVIWPNDKSTNGVRSLIYDLGSVVA
jgi:hypothetical protein